MAFIVTYLKFDSSEVQIKKLFLNFFPLHRKNADKVIKSILDELQQNSLDIMTCRGQTYDNASTIAGIRSGVQCIIKQVNCKAIFIPCADHSLNFAGVHQWHCLNILQHFLLLWKGYTLFFASTQRWGVLLKHVPIVVKRVIDTR